MKCCDRNKGRNESSFRYGDYTTHWRRCPDCAQLWSRKTKVHDLVTPWKRGREEALREGQDDAYMRLAQKFLRWQPYLCSNQSVESQSFHVQFADWTEANYEFLLLGQGLGRSSRLLDLLPKGRPYGSKSRNRETLDGVNTGKTNRRVSLWPKDIDGKPIDADPKPGSSERTHSTALFLQLWQHLGDVEPARIQAAVTKTGRKSKEDAAIYGRVSEFLKSCSNLHTETIADALGCSQRTAQRLIG